MRGPETSDVRLGLPRRVLGVPALPILFAVWATVACLFAIEGYLVALYRGTPQPWWPSFAYTMAVFSIWGLLTPAIWWHVSRTAERRWRVRLAIVAAGLPVAVAAHVLLFVAIYWPVYGASLGLVEMGERVLIANIDTDIVFYLLLASLAIVLRRRTEPVAVAPAETSLAVRARGTTRLVPLSAIDWIEAAGGYSEVRAGPATHLLDESLASLTRRLPAGEFARIHRRTLVRLDRVAELRGVGHGDAVVRLSDGAELRVSRRFRDALERRLGSR